MSDKTSSAFPLIGGLPPEVVARALEGARIGVWEWDLATGEIRTSDSLARSAGYSPDDVVPNIKFWTDRIHTDDIARVEWERASHLSGASDRYQAEYRVRCKDGSWLWIQSIGKVDVRDEHGKPLRIAGIHTDISLRKEAETALDRERSLFRDGPVIVFRWQNKEGWPVEKVSPNVYRLFGHSAEDFLTGRVPYADTIHPDDLARVAEEVTEHSTLNTARFEQGYRIIHKSGQVRWLYDYTVIIRNDDGEITHYEGYVLDDSERQAIEVERKDIERRVHLAQKLEGLGVLAGGIAHDFNNLLVGIMGNIELAQQQLPSGSPLQEALGDSLAASVRAAELVHGMLVYAGRAQKALRAVDLNAMLLEMRRLLLSGLDHNVEVLLMLDDGAPVIVGDTAQLSQVFMNLMINAAESIEGADGRISVSTAPIKLDATQAEAVQGFDGRTLCAGEYVQVVVQDNGCGMTPVAAQSLFDPFYTTKFSGRGLGLSSVLGTLRGHNGTIEVDSKVGKGTRFRLLLPRSMDAPGPASQPPPAITAPSPARDATILVVDDEPSVLKLARTCLAMQGYRVLLAESGEQGLALIESCPEDAKPHMVLLDMTMPGLSGYETYVKLREFAPTLPVIFSSGYPENEVLEMLRAGELKHTSFLPKPYTATALCSAVSGVLG